MDAGLFVSVESAVPVRVGRRAGAGRGEELEALDCPLRSALGVAAATIRDGVLTSVVFRAIVQ
jgi:hypothetical protein